MSRGQVLRDQLLELAGGDPAQAAEVLGELFANDPELLRDALSRAWPAHGDAGGRVLLATLIATQWSGPPSVRTRLDLLRGEIVAELKRYRLPTGEQAWQVRVWGDGVEQDLGNALTLEEGERRADEALTEEGERRWHLL